jgi:hypothetical protein
MSAEHVPRDGVRTTQPIEPLTAEEWREAIVSTVIEIETA